MVKGDLRQRIKVWTRMVLVDCCRAAYRNGVESLRGKRKPKGLMIKDFVTKGRKEMKQWFEG
jgi:hypothetical protein